jgi:uncharacterized membrane protein
MIASAVGTLLAAGNASQVLAADEAGKEKCYGVVQAGKNDCATSAHSCQGEAKKDRDAKKWIYLPKGTCERIAGASLKPVKQS